MYLDNLNKENVIVLDELVRICINDWSISKVNLPSVKMESPFGDLPEIKLGHYRSYCEILKKSEVVSVDLMQDDIWIAPIEGITKPFLDNGGFTKLFNDRQKEIEHQHLLKEKDKIDVEISKFNRDKQKTYYTFTVVSFILSLLAIGISIFSVFKS